MVAFDITPPELTAPNWDRVSRPIQQPESIQTKLKDTITPDKSTGLALETLAGGIESAAKLYDGSEKYYLKDKVTTCVDKLRDDYTAAYLNIRNQQQGLIPPQPPTLILAETASVP